MVEPNMSPKVSVLMPAFNAEAFIDAAVESVLSQTYRDFEFVILDDASTDGTWAHLEKYAVRDHRIRLVRNACNQDIAAARNKLIGLSRGTYIAWQDADDVSYPDRITLQVAHLDAHPEVGIVGGQLYACLEEAGKRSYKAFPLDDATLRRKIFRYMAVAQPAAMIRRSVFERVGEYDPRYPPSEDLDMLFRIGEQFEFANVSQPVLLYREHKGNATHHRLRRIDCCTISIRTRYANSRSYEMSVWDHWYNIAHYISALLLPAGVRLWVFRVLRYSKKPHPSCPNNA